jgi:hypothetical protein
MSKNTQDSSDTPNQIEKEIENIDKKDIPIVNYLYKDKINIIDGTKFSYLYKDKINTIVNDIKKIADSDTNQNKSETVKQAEACFKLLGQETHQLCPHGVLYFQCMPCSH